MLDYVLIQSEKYNGALKFRTRYYMAMLEISRSFRESLLFQVCSAP